MKEVEQLEQAVARMHKCTAKHIGSEHVKEVVNNVVVWDADVQIFELKGHPKSTKCYAWSYRESNGDLNHIAVLERPPVVKSAETAVKMHLMARAAKA